TTEDFAQATLDGRAAAIFILAAAGAVGNGQNTHTDGRHRILLTSSVRTRSLPVSIVWAIFSERTMITQWTFHSAVSLTFGRGAVQTSGDIVRHLGIRRAFVLTDETLQRIGLVETVSQCLRNTGVEHHICTKGRAEPALSLVQSCFEVARDFAPDGI